MRGFRAAVRPPGAPDLPSRIYRVAIPAGAEPRLFYRVVSERVRSGVRPVAVSRDRFDAEGDGGATLRVRRHRVREEDPAIYGRSGMYPRDAVRLGEIGTLRDQRYVEVIVTPARFDRTTGEIRIAGAIEVEVGFEGGARGTSTPTLEPALEPVYREAFVNYGQGATFRLGAGDTAAPVMTGGVDATTDRHRIRIRQNGPVRLDHALLSGTTLASEPLSTWKLSAHGHELALQVHDPGLDDVLDPGDWVQFYGQALDFEPVTVLNAEPGSGEQIWAANDFTDENIYWLGAESGARSRLGSIDATPVSGATPPDHFEAFAAVEVDDQWRPLDDADPWCWSPSLIAKGATPVREEAVPLPGLHDGTLGVRVVTELRGFSTSTSLNPDHRTAVSLLGTGAEVLASEEKTFDGRTVEVHDFTWDGSGGAIADPVTVRVEALEISGQDHTVNLDRIELRYRRSFEAAGNMLLFHWPDGPERFEIPGFDDAAIEVWEITADVAGSGLAGPVRLDGVEVVPTGGGEPGAFKARFEIDDDAAVPDGEPRTFVAFGDSVPVTPSGSDFELDVVSDLRDNGLQADLIVVAHPDVLDPGPGSTPLDDLLALRASQGITSKVALLGDVEDEFNDGLPGPDAIRRFVAWVLSDTPGEGWADPRPRYLLLLGDGSYNYKAGPAKGNVVPTQVLFLDRVQLGFYASDNDLAAAVGDDPMPDLVVARLPARGVTDANRVLDKIREYETVAPDGTWRRNGLFIADRGKDYSAGEANDFETTNEQSAAYMKTPPYTVEQLQHWQQFCNQQNNVCDADGMRQAIEDAINGLSDAADGAATAQFIGHGNYYVWSDDAFLDDRPGGPRDTDAFVNGLRLPWMMAHNCLTGGFHLDQTDADNSSVGENWLMRDGGGAVAVFSPTGLSFNFLGRDVANSIWDDLHGAPKERSIAVPVMNALGLLCGQGSIEPCQHYAFLGDPSQNLLLPSVEPAADVVAMAGNAVIDLTWTASGTSGATYDVYRTTDPERVAYTLANGAPIPGTAFTDTDLVNTRAYYYAVVAVDPEGFESRWSHFNSDCDVSGPDCLTATPLNPNPPGAPTGVVVTDPENGGRLHVVWNPVPEADLDVYEVHYGTSSGDYTEVLDAGRETSALLNGLENGTTYYIAVTATNSSGLRSAYSLEAEGTPTFVRGPRYPDVVRELRVDRAGSDAVLTWNAVASDIYGGALSTSHYDVYRSIDPGFVPQPADRIAQVATSTYTDPGAAAGGAPSYYYLVRAVDSGGLEGAVGRALPGGVEDLAIGKTAGDPVRLDLTWSPVAIDIDGLATLVDHYEVYASDQPFTRADIDDGSVTALTTTVVTTLQIDLPAGNAFYSVVAVDNRGNRSPY